MEDCSGPGGHILGTVRPVQLEWSRVMSRGEPLAENFDFFPQGGWERWRLRSRGRGPIRVLACALWRPQEERLGGLGPTARGWGRGGGERESQEEGGLWESWGAAALEGHETDHPPGGCPRAGADRSRVLERGASKFKLHTNVGRKGLGPIGGFSPLRSHFREQIQCC